MAIEQIKNIICGLFTANKPDAQLTGWFHDIFMNDLAQGGGECREQYAFVPCWHGGS